MACQQFRTRDCDNMDILLCCNTLHGALRPFPTPFHFPPATTWHLAVLQLIARCTSVSDRLFQLLPCYCDSQCSSSSHAIVPAPPMLLRFTLFQLLPCYCDSQCFAPPMLLRFAMFRSSHAIAIRNVPAPPVVLLGFTMFLGLKPSHACDSIACL
jgi:hypothetical protein